jgi:hypothetical protein
MNRAPGMCACKYSGASESGLREIVPAVGRSTADRRGAGKLVGGDEVVNIACRL